MVPNQYGKVGVAMRLQGPSAKCMVCQQAIVSLTVDTTRFTMGDLIKKVVKGVMAFNCPSVQMENLEYVEGDDLDDDEKAESAALLPLMLSALPGGGITHNTSIGVLDQTQDLKVMLIVQHRVCPHTYQHVLYGTLYTCTHVF